MRKIIIYILIMFFMASCSESEYDATRTPSLNRRYLFVPTTSMSFEAHPSVQKITVESEQTGWVLNIPIDWVKSNQMSGDSSATLELSTLLNNSADTSRVCVATISSNVSDWNRTFPITITQKKNSPYITIDENNIILSAIKQSSTTSLSTNTEYYVENTGSSWLHIDSFSSSEVKYTVDENNTDKERDAILTLKAKSYPGTSTSITVRQKIANITATKDKLTFGHNSSSQLVEIESEASWTTTSTSWLSVTPNSGVAGKTPVTISVPNNASTNGRTGSVYFKIADNNNIEVPIEQEGETLEVSANSLSFDSFGGTQALTITSNESWKIASKPDWLSISKSSGDGNETIHISTSENNTTTAKNGEIIIATTDGVASANVSIMQEAKHVEYSDANLSFGYAPETQTISFTTNGIWSVTKDADWFSIDKSSGSGSATLTISVEENNTSDERVGKAILTIADQTYTVAIHQTCKYVTLSSSAFTFTADAGSTKLSIGSNTNWNARLIEGNEWMSITPTEGANTAEVSINVTENKTIDARRGKIEIEIPNIKTYIVEVVQNRRYIKTDMSSVEFLPTGGQISFNVITDGTYEVEKIGIWFGFVKNGDVITVVAQENTTEEERRGAIKLNLTNVKGEISILIPIRQINIIRQ